MDVATTIIADTKFVSISDLLLLLYAASAQGSEVIATSDLIEALTNLRDQNSKKERI